MHLNSPLLSPSADLLKEQDEIPLPKNQEKCLREKTRQLASAYVRASSARVRNSAFSARWAKPALAPQALLSPPYMCEFAAPLTTN